MRSVKSPYRQTSRAARGNRIPNQDFTDYLLLIMTTLNTIVLAGGQSKRMGRDKALILWDG
ncbi:MAG: NTP transferase domain-containing protein, partial [Geitlerinemataceae cyanobacterium]